MSGLSKSRPVLIQFPASKQEKSDAQKLAKSQDIPLSQLIRRLLKEEQDRVTSP